MWQTTAFKKERFMIEKKSVYDSPDASAFSVATRGQASPKPPIIATCGDAPQSVSTYPGSNFNVSDTNELLST